MNLYFGSIVANVSSVLVLATLAFIAFTLVKYKSVELWGRRVAVLALLGLVVCCFVAVRDGYHLSVQAYFDADVTDGLFTIASPQSILCCIGGAIIAFSSVSSIFVKNQKYRKVVFFILSCVVVLKTVIIEVSRWLA